MSEFLGCATPPPMRGSKFNDSSERLCSSEPSSLMGSPAHRGGRWASPAATLVVETEWDGKEVTVVDGYVKFRDNKRWKQRWGVVTKLSPAADRNLDLVDEM
ncbi:uncharacterized protein LOC135946398 [Cloeon dipterum]|uniref:uncharacterized protein LOC135946398 n=1 Tax=Cloeon dipterum TaxID=197152 RepID=UPI0032200ACF